MMLESELESETHIVKRHNFYLYPYLLTRRSNDLTMLTFSQYGARSEHFFLHEKFHLGINFCSPLLPTATRMRYAPCETRAPKSNPRGRVTFKATLTTAPPRRHLGINFCPFPWSASVTVSRKDSAFARHNGRNAP